MKSDQPNKKKQLDTNVKVFMQTEAYAQANSELQWQLNNNSQVFNLKIPQPSNLNEHTVKVKRIKAETVALKKAKHDFKLLPNQGREKVIEALVQSPMPNWNIKFVERRKNLS